MEERRRRVLAGGCVVAGLFLAGLPGHGATSLRELRYSSDTAMIVGALVLQDEDVVVDDLSGMLSRQTFGTLPAGWDIDGYHEAGDGSQWLSGDTAAVVGGVFAEAADVVSWSGGEGELLFDASEAGIPGGIGLDAVTGDGTELIVSFDGTVALPGGDVAEDEDLVRVDDELGLVLFFDGSEAGVPTELDLDGAHLLPGGSLLLSFDGSGSLEGSRGSGARIFFEDEDVLEYDPVQGGWELVFDGSAAEPGWLGGDLDALAATSLDPGPGGPQVEAVGSFGAWLLVLAAVTLVFRRRFRRPASAAIRRAAGKER